MVVWGETRPNLLCSCRWHFDLCFEGAAALSQDSRENGIGDFLASLRLRDRGIFLWVAEEAAFDEDCRVFIFDENAEPCGFDAAVCKSASPNKRAFNVSRNLSGLRVVVVRLEAVCFSVGTVVEVDAYENGVVLPIGNSRTFIQRNEDVAASGDDGSEAAVPQLSV